MLETQNIVLGLTANTQEAVIRSVVERANELGAIHDVETTVQSVLAREQEGTTGFGKGVAIPHGKTDGVKEPILMFATLASPVEWNSLDEKPVDMLFMILVPETAQSQHLQILAKLARRLMHQDFVDHLRNEKSAQAITTYIQEQLA
ncbi:fructose PTS transporter subunit IIA [Alicyclobacillus fastidiosus]|uniref:Fructose PTS transporter subunit IIA n=1 Tax=Alicyclobacillus fastidiosus TaxID=392011 RepID=A0ABY6ZDH5_9BACL|nr:fructose PTS transporter subunit IIA [Alicyclobacillus fastidiosus]WAH40943.1 fructose PTS transporter subunit IIA [Alicyclobacillus fastidiosus]GMA62449.1 PTS mannose transporter subunit IIAB [Alicyclobacillus fastidiosus]